MDIKKFLSILALLLFSSIAMAHPGHSGHEGLGFVNGFLHPLTGFDHLLAMFAVGLWAAQQQGKARFAVPATFVVTMLIGGLLASSLGVWLPFLENAIAVSVLALGLLVALALRPPLPLAMLAAALFAINHGYAHGMEVPALASPAEFALGFLLATIGLHGAGFGLAKVLSIRYADFIRAFGTFAAGVGLWMLAT